MLELRNGLVMFELSLCMGEICVSMINEIELRRRECDIVMYCKMRMNTESLIILFMFAYQIR